MKTKFVLFILGALIFVCFFSFSVSADDCEHNLVPISYDFINDDIMSGGSVTRSCSREGCKYTESERFSSFIEHIGYSVSGCNILSSYTIYSELIDEYADFSGARAEYGLIVTRLSMLNGRLPLHSNGVVVNDSYVNKMNFTSYHTSFYDVYIPGVNDAELEIFISAYLVIDGLVYYVQENGPVTSFNELSSVSYKSICGEEIKFGGFSTDKTQMSYDREKQMASSNASYNTGSELSDSEIFSINTIANGIALGGNIANYPNASKLMSHYLNGSGKKYTLDLNEFFKDEAALANRNSDINRALRASEAFARVGEKATMYQSTESIFHNLSGDWKYSLGSYFSSVEIYDLTVNYINNQAVYSAKIKYIVRDFYNWDTNDKNDVFGLVSPYELHQLHVSGTAREFFTYGEKEYTIYWTIGQDISEILK